MFLVVTVSCDERFVGRACTDMQNDGHDRVNPTAMPVRLGQHLGVVHWDAKRNTYAAVVDVFGFAESGSWFRESERWTAPIPGSPPVLIVGDRFAQHITVDSLRYELARRGLEPDPPSWDRILALRTKVIDIFGETIVVVDLVGPLCREPRTGNGSYEAPDSELRLDLFMPNGSWVNVPPRLVFADNWSPSPRFGTNVFEVAAQVVDLVWSAGRGNTEESIAMELAFEVFSRRAPFALTAGSLAEWVAHGTGLRWRFGPELLEQRAGQRSSFSQLALEV